MADSIDQPRATFETDGDAEWSTLLSRLSTDRARRREFSDRLIDAKALGEISEDVDAVEAACFLASTLSGMKVSVRAGAGPDELRSIARMAIRSLR
jgi:TetR/AcrR family transcriptional regulator, transcriptional repressor for nem operon